MIIFENTDYKIQSFISGMLSNNSYLITSKTSKKNIIIDFTDNNTDEKVHFVVAFPDKKLEMYIKNDTLESKLKLIRKIRVGDI